MHNRETRRRIRKQKTKMDLFARKLEGRKEGQGKKVDYHRGIALTHTKTLFKDNTSLKKGFESQP